MPTAAPSGTRLDEQTAERMAEFFGALSDPTRVRIIAALMEEEKNVGELAASTGTTESAISHQMRNLRHLRIVRARRDGRQIFYHLDDEHVRDLFQRTFEHIRHE